MTSDRRIIWKIVGVSAALIAPMVIGCQATTSGNRASADTASNSVGELASGRPKAHAERQGTVTTSSHGNENPGVEGRTIERVSADVALETSQLGPTDQAPRAELIDLCAALRLAGVDNPTINLAREQVQEALAGQLAARSLLIPNVNIGGNFRTHTGAQQASPGFIRTPNAQSLYLGAGAGAIGAGTLVFPGVWLYAHLGDAAYEPLVARQRVAARESSSQAVLNSVLLDVATAYLELVGAEERLAILRRAETELAEIVRVTSAFAKSGQGAVADANRAKANGLLLRRQIQESEGAIAAASARLARLLNLDPSAILRTPGGPVPAFRLIAEGDDLESLVGTAIRSRPELFARSVSILEAQAQVRQERVRPWLPLVAVGYSSGFFGGGSDQASTEFGPLTGRSDLAVAAIWTLQNLGVGNHARVRRANSVVGEAVASHDAMLNQVRREVAEGQAAAKTAATQLSVATSSLAAAEEGFRLETERIAQGQGRPIEALDSFRQLLDARLEALRAAVAFDVAQFQLFVAVGNNPESGACDAATDCPISR